MSVCGGVILHKVTKKGLHNNFEICQKLVGWLWHKTNVLLELTQIFEILRQKMHILLFTKFGYQQVLFIRQIKHNGTKTWVMDTCCGIANTYIIWSMNQNPFYHKRQEVCNTYPLLQLMLGYSIILSNTSPELISNSRRKACFPLKIRLMKQCSIS